MSPAPAPPIKPPNAPAPTRRSRSGNSPSFDVMRSPSPTAPAVAPRRIPDGTEGAIARSVLGTCSSTAFPRRPALSPFPTANASSKGRAPIAPSVATAFQSVSAERSPRASSYCWANHSPRADPAPPPAAPPAMAPGPVGDDATTPSAVPAMPGTTRRAVDAAVSYHSGCFSPSPAAHAGSGRRGRGPRAAKSAGLSGMGRPQSTIV